MYWRALLPLLLAACGTRAAAVDIHDIRGPLSIDTLPPFVLTGGFLLLAAGLLLIRRSRRHQSGTLPPPVVAHPDANDLLARLSADYREGACPGEQIVLRLDGIVRATLAATTGIPAQRLTSAELRAAGAACLDAGQRALLKDLLPLFDRVKFAGHQSNRGEVEWALDTVGRLLNASRQDRCHEVP